MCIYIYIYIYIACRASVLDEIAADGVPKMTEKEPTDRGKMQDSSKGVQWKQGVVVYIRL